MNAAQLKAKIQKDPYYRLQSLAEVAIAAQLGVKINVTHASIDDWLRLPGISIHQARTLVELVNLGVEFLCLEDIAAALNLPSQRLKPLEPLLQFCYYEDKLSPSKINPNNASLEQLQALPFISPTLAQGIITNRQQQGDFKNLADFQRRLHLERNCISQLIHYLVF
jgi:DNA uptake protein ComE-like DNA-binding protein